MNNLDDVLSTSVRLTQYEVTLRREVRKGAHAPSLVIFAENCTEEGGSAVPCQCVHSGAHGQLPYGEDHPHCLGDCPDPHHGHRDTGGGQAGDKWQDILCL